MFAGVTMNYFILNLLVTAEGVEEFASPRIAARHTHGTGCTLASAMAAGLAQGMGLRGAVVRARAYVRAAIAAAPAPISTVATWRTYSNPLAMVRV